MAYFFLFLFTVMICWASFFHVVLTIDPFAVGFMGFFFFYLSLFFSAGGTFVFLSFFLRRRFHPAELPGLLMKVSLRQGFLLALVLDISLYFLSKNMLRWWNGIFLVLMVLVIEAFFQLTKKTRNASLGRGFEQAETDVQENDVK